MFCYFFFFAICFFFLVAIQTIVFFMFSITFIFHVKTLTRTKPIHSIVVENYTCSPILIWKKLKERKCWNTISWNVHQPFSFRCICHLFVIFFFFIELRKLVCHVGITSFKIENFTSINYLSFCSFFWQIKTSAKL